ncbi:FAD-binding oxidoreductase, partial [Actinomadura rubrisoli]
TALPHLLTALDKARPGIAVTWSGSGHGHVGLPAGLAPGDVAAVLGSLRDVLAGHNGRAIVRYTPQEARGAIDFWGPVPALALMRRVKDQFDPDHRLSPGRFVGGI